LTEQGYRYVILYEDEIPSALPELTLTPPPTAD